MDNRYLNDCGHESQERVGDVHAAFGEGSPVRQEPDKTDEDLDVERDRKVELDVI